MSELGRGGAEGQGSRGDASFPLLPRSPAPLRFLLQPAAAALFALCLYRRALGFAYFNDDPTGHFAWMQGQSLGDFFTSSAAYGYYRPVVFAALRLFETLFGSPAWPHNPFADHALLLLLHAANTALVWAVARRLGGRDAFAWVAALVFAALPFSYEAVAYVASLTHPLLVFWLLSALLLYDRRIQRKDAKGQRRKGGEAGLSPYHHRLNTEYCILFTVLVLGLLTHENGVFILPALAGLDWLRRPGDGLRARLRRLWPLAVPVTLYLALWLAIPKNSQQGLNAPAGIAGNAVPFLQTLAFPLLPLLRLEAGNTAALVAVALGVVLLTGWLAWRAGVARLWAFAVGWVALSALPALLFLSPAYVYGSPRLSYLPAVGVALLWGIPLLGVEERFRNRVSSEKLGFYGTVALTAVYLMALLLPTRPFVACQLDFYAETSRLARALGRIGIEAPPGRELVFINAPFFFSSFAARPDGCPSPYPWTPTGGILIPPYAAAEDFVRFNGGPQRATTGVTFSGYAPGWRTFGPEMAADRLPDLVRADAVYVFDLARGDFFDLTTAWRPGEAPREPLATFGDALALVGETMAVEGDHLVVALDWQVLAPPDFLPAVFLHVAEASGVPAAQSDDPLAGGFAPVELWASGDGLSDERHLDLASLAPGRYRVLAGIYNPADGVRLPATQSGTRLTNDAWVLGTIER